MDETWQLTKWTKPDTKGHILYDHVYTYYICINICIHIYMHMYTYACICTHVCIHICICMCIYMCAYMYIHMCIYIIYVHIQINIHICIYGFSLSYVYMKMVILVVGSRVCTHRNVWPERGWEEQQQHWRRGVLTTYKFENPCIHMFLSLRHIIHNGFFFQISKLTRMSMSVVKNHVWKRT